MSVRGGSSGLVCPECGARNSHHDTCSRAVLETLRTWVQCKGCGARATAAHPRSPEIVHLDTCPVASPVRADEGAARVAWVAFLNSQIDGGTTHEMVEETRTTLDALPEAERASHETWRNRVVSSVEATLRGWLPPEPPEEIGEPCRATTAELGYFETVGRSLGVLPNAQRIRILVAALVAQAHESDIPPVELSITVTRTARQYYARLKQLCSSAPYDGRGLIGYAFPPEKP